MSSFHAHRLIERELKGNLRKLCNKNSLIDFSSNDYLGLARSQILKNRAFNEFKDCKIGSTGSRLLTGNSKLAEQIEKQISKYHGFESGLLFGSGYMANLGLLSSVANQEDVIFYDTHIHASMHDGIRLSGAAAFPFRHNDVNHLESRLKKVRNVRYRFVCIESLYSMDGTLAPLEEISFISTRYDAKLIVDEAHSIGILGNQGSGLVAEKKLCNSVFAQISTFGKAIGVYGAIVLGKQLLKEYLCNFARSFIYSTALPFPILVSIKHAYELLPSLEKERAYLQSLIALFQKSDFGATCTPIQTIKIKGNSAVQHLSQYLAIQGFDVRPIMSPTVRRGEESLRICLHAFNKEQEVINLIDSLNDYRKNHA